MARHGATWLVLLLIQFCQIFQVKGENFTKGYYLTNPNPTKPDTYLEEYQPLPSDKTYYIYGFEPTVTMDMVHHMIISGCQQCRAFTSQWICTGDTSIMYAWAKNAPPLYLPPDVGFKIGKDGYQCLRVELHFSNVSNLAGKNMKHLGVKILYTDVEQPKLAGVLVMGVGAGQIPPKKQELFDTACQIKQDVHMHVFAFRPHTHHLGKVVAGYRGVHTSDGKLNWTQIGKQDPQKPQMFYPSNQVVIQKGDIIAARCTMFNFKDYTVGLGGASHNEMCNYYVMYWVEDEKFPQTYCFTSGPPKYYWEKDPSLPNVPTDSTHLDK